MLAALLILVNDLPNKIKRFVRAGAAGCGAHFSCLRERIAGCF
jgi:hypothetical protein